MVFTLNRDTLRAIKIGGIASNPRTILKYIAINNDKKALIASRHFIVEVDANEF